ncbi:putative fimbrial outer membrane usher protein [Escherichia coli]|nr:putative fimbrial outer membrane usher protein [Escherichia coli]
MPLRRFSPGLKAQFAFGMVFLFVQPDASAADISAQQIGGVIIPQAFSQALQDGMSVPLYIHLAGSQGRQDDQRIGSAFIWLDDGQLRIRKIQLEESEDNASVSEQTRQQLMALANAPFNVLTPKSWTVKHEAYRSDSDIQLESDLLISG